VQLYRLHGTESNGLDCMDVFKGGLTVHAIPKHCPVYGYVYQGHLEEKRG